MRRKTTRETDIAVVNLYRRITYFRQETFTFEETYEIQNIADRR